MRKVSIFIRSVLLRQSSGKIRGHWIHRIVRESEGLCVVLISAIRAIALFLSWESLG